MSFPVEVSGKIKNKILIFICTDSFGSRYVAWVL